MADIRWISENFKGIPDMRDKCNQAEFQKWFDEWKEVKDANSNSILHLDKRNNIWCLNPSYDIRMYYNYLTYLNKHYDSWVGHGYLDMGLLPYTVLPSFISTITDQSGYTLDNWLKTLAESNGCKYVDTPPVSFLQLKPWGNKKDAWIWRDELVKLARTIEQNTQGKYSFKFKDEDDVTMTGFLEGLLVGSEGHI